MMSVTGDQFEHFSRSVVGRLLRDYQMEVARAILASIAGRDGAIFTVMMARQMGKSQDPDLL
jgi:hypothetical protein